MTILHLESRHDMTWHDMTFHASQLCRISNNQACVIPDKDSEWSQYWALYLAWRISLKSNDLCISQNKKNTLWVQAKVWQNRIIKLLTQLPKSQNGDLAKRYNGKWGRVGQLPPSVLYFTAVIYSYRCAAGKSERLTKFCDIKSLGYTGVWPGFLHW